jgi:hypothetical protein
MLPVSAASWPSKLTADAAFLSEAPTVDDTEDYPDQATVQDVVVKHAGTRVQITGEGSLILASQKPIRVQMPYRSYLRVSIEGTDALERLLLAGPTVDVINTLTNKVAELGSRLATVELALNTLLAKMAAAAPVAGLVADAISTMATISNPYVSPSTAAAEDVSSAAFMVSSQTVTDTQSSSE